MKVACAADGSTSLKVIWVTGGIDSHGSGSAERAAGVDKESFPLCVPVTVVYVRGKKILRFSYLLQPFSNLLIWEQLGLLGQPVTSSSLCISPLHGCTELCTSPHSPLQRAGNLPRLSLTEHLSPEGNIRRELCATECVPSGPTCNLGPRWCNCVMWSGIVSRLFSYHSLLSICCFLNI